MTTNLNAATIQETGYLNECLIELAEADRLGDEVRRFYAVEEVAGIAINTSVTDIAAQANAALAVSRAKAKRANRRHGAAVRLKAAASSHSLPACSLVSIDAEGELLVYEF